jgi:hypothetical protein
LQSIGTSKPPLFTYPTSVGYIPGLPDFSWRNIPKMGKNDQIITKYNKYDPKIYKMTVK